MDDISDGDRAFARAEQSVGLFQITEALLGRPFPATRAELLRSVGDETVLLEEAVSARLGDVLRALPDDTYDTPQDVVAWVQRRWPRVLDAGRPVEP